jgi:hypothetical protein
MRATVVFKTLCVAPAVVYVTEFTSDDPTYDVSRKDAALFADATTAAATTFSTRTFRMRKRPPSLSNNTPALPDDTVQSCRTTVMGPKKLPASTRCRMTKSLAKSCRNNNKSFLHQPVGPQKMADRGNTTRKNNCSSSNNIIHHHPPRHGASSSGIEYRDPTQHFVVDDTVCGSESSGFPHFLHLCTVAHENNNNNNKNNHLRNTGCPQTLKQTHAHRA